MDKDDRENCTTSVVNEVKQIEEPCKGSLALRRLSKKASSPKEIWLKRHSEAIAARNPINTSPTGKSMALRADLQMTDSTLVKEFKLINNNSTQIINTSYNPSHSEDSPINLTSTTNKLSFLKIAQSTNDGIASKVHLSPQTNVNSFNFTLFAIQPITPFNNLPNMFTFSPIATSPMNFDSATASSFIISPSAYISSSTIVSPAPSLTSSPNPDCRRHLFARRRSSGLIRPICLTKTESQSQVVSYPTTPVSLTLPPSPRALLSPIPEMKTIENESVASSGNQNQQQHRCSYCQRCFSRSDMLSRHLRLHTGLRPYECPYCTQVFSRSDHLQTHLRTHTGEKPYRCAECGYAAPRRDMVTRHMRVHENRNDSASRIKKTKSSECLALQQKESISEDEALRQRMRQEIRAMYERNQITKKQMVDSQIQDYVFKELKKLKTKNEGSDQPIHLSLSMDAAFLDAAAVSVKEEIKDYGFEDSELSATSFSPDLHKMGTNNHCLLRTVSEGSMDSGVSYLTPCTPASTLWSPSSPEVFITTTETTVRDASRFQWPAESKS